MEKKSKLTERITLKGLSDSELKDLSARMTLSLTLEEMKAIRARFEKIGRDPSDIELETLAQTWSEHCKHKIFNAEIHYGSGKKSRHYKNLFKETIKKATETVREKAGEKDICVSVFTDNAGIIKYNDKFSAAFKVETHNHPSALDPYGGANTGIGGVIRDILGCGLAAKPVFNTDVFCFASPAFPWSKLPKGIMHPKRIFKGVVAGVRDYGNRMGIPTINGSINFHDQYLGNPLVFCGTAGLIPNDKILKETLSGYDIITCGGRTGRDGIHGATFSSVELHSESETTDSQAVQIGNPIEEKKVQDIILQARDLGLYTNITDCGAGGFASAIGEIAKDTGADVWLDKAPLKYPGLKPWEIFLSESQERMIVLINPSKTEQFLALCASEDVEAAVIGRTAKHGRLDLYYRDELTGSLEMEFLHEGVPTKKLKAVPKITPVGKKPAPKITNYGKILQTLLSDPNSASKEAVIRQYDHEVGGGNFMKPLQGLRNDGPGDSSAYGPLLNEPEKCLLVSNGINIRFGLIDPGRMAMSVIDEAFRQIIAAGGDPEHTAILDNFCWGNPDRDGQVSALVEAAQACHDTAVAYGLPFISGKDSFYNEFKMSGKTISIPPTLLISAISVTQTKFLTPSFIQKSGSVLFLAGLTKDELGGSSLYTLLGRKDGKVPDIDLKNGLKMFKALANAIHAGLVLSCHDLSENGLAGSLAEMSFSGEKGLDVDLGKLKSAAGNKGNGILHPSVKTDLQILFSESNTRFLCEVSAENTDKFIKTMKGFPCAMIGRSTEEQNLTVKGLNGRTIIKESLAALKKAWQKELI